MKNFNSNNKTFNCFSPITAVASIFLLATVFCFSQDCNYILEGKIVDIHDNTPLDAAVIQVIQHNTNTISNADGTFILKNQCEGKITLKISHINCEDYIKEIELKGSTSIEIRMDHHVESLDEVVLSKLKVDKLSSTNKIHSLSELQRERYSNKGLAGALEQISGVNMLSTGNSIAKPVIHGMFGSRVGIVYDGAVLENQQWGQDHAPNVDLNAFENIRLIKGSGTLKYTGATPGGVVILESVIPSAVDSLYGKTILSGMTNGRGSSLISNWVKSYSSGTYFKIQSTLKKHGDFSAPNYVLSNTGSKENNVSVSFGKNGISNMWKIYFSYFDTEIGILRSSHIGNTKDLLRAIESDVPLVINPFSNNIVSPKQGNKHYTANVGYTNTSPSNNKWNVNYSWQYNNRKEYDIRRGDLKNVAALDLDLNTHNLTSNYEWSTALINFDSGLFFQIQDNYSNPNTGIKRLIPDYLKTKLGSYFTATYSHSKDLNFGFGLRYEFQHNNVQKFYRDSRWISENYETELRPFVVKEELSQKLVNRNLRFNTLSFNTGARYSLSQAHTLAFNYNYAQRAPDIAEMFSDGLHHSLASIEYGNPFLKKETTHKFVVDFEKKGGSFQYAISPFLTYGKNYIIIEPSGLEQTIRGAFPVWEYKAVNGLLKGVDLDLSLTFNNALKFEHNTSWVEAENIDTHLPLINIPPLTLKNQIQFSLPKWKSFFVSLNSKNVFIQNRFPDNNFPVTVVENGERVQKIVDISTPPSGYHNLGVDLNWGTYSLFSSKIAISLSFENILNNGYRNYLNRLRYYSDEIGRNIMLQLKIYH